MTTNYFEDSFVSIRPKSHGSYTIVASLYGFDVDVFTTDSGLYDMFKDEDTRDKAKRIMFESALPEIEDKAFEKFYRAVYTTNADPALCEDSSTAMMLAEALWLNDQELTADDFEDEEEWANMLAKLDMQGKDVRAIHRSKIDGVELLVCFDEDYDY